MSEKPPVRDPAAVEREAALKAGRRIHGPMEMAFTDPSVRDEIAETALRPFYEHIARIAGQWGLLEVSLDQLIWRLSGMHPHIGACVTSQYGSTYTRFKAIAALLGLSNNSEGIVKKINAFSNDAEPLVRKRNRAVHDPIAFGDPPTTILSYRSTAERKLDVGWALANLDDYKKTLTQIRELRIAFEALRVDIETHIASVGTPPPSPPPSPPESPRESR